MIGTDFTGIYKLEQLNGQRVYFFFNICKPLNLVNIAKSEEIFIENRKFTSCYHIYFVHVSEHSLKGSNSYKNLKTTIKSEMYKWFIN